MRATLRPARVDDLPELMRLWRREVECGRQDVLPNEVRFRRMLSRFDWEARSRVVDDGGRLTGSVLVTSRPSPEGVLANLYPAGEDGVYGDMAAWGARVARAAGAAIVQVFAGKGRGGALSAAGLHDVRTWWRMDRSLEAGAPPARAPAPGYAVVDARTPLPGSWSELFNATFADHWRFAPRADEEIVGDRPPELCLAAVTGARGAPVALALAEVETYDADPRPQPVLLVSSVGTLPTHRRRGLAGLLVAELLARGGHAGARSASLYVDAQSPHGADRVYRKLGFDVAYQAEVWEATFP